MLAHPDNSKVERLDLGPTVKTRSSITGVVTAEA
jgi:hypothetical protein